MNLLPVLVVLLAQVDTNVPDDDETTPSSPPPLPDLVIVANEDRPVPPRSPKPPPPVSLRFDGAYAPRKLFSLPVSGADFGGGVFVQPSDHTAVGGSVRGFVGGTENGLRVWDIRGLGEAEAIAFDRLHLGGGIGVFVLGVERAARDETIRSWGPQLQAHARLDVVRADDFALFVRGAVSGGYDLYDSSMFWGPSLGAGFDLDIAGQRRSP
jgi:hypothetical protein